MDTTAGASPSWQPVLRAGPVLALAPSGLPEDDAGGLGVLLELVPGALPAELEPIDLHVRFLAAPERPSPWLATSDRLSTWAYVTAPDAVPAVPGSPTAEFALPVGATASLPSRTSGIETHLRVGAVSATELELALVLGPAIDPHVAVLSDRVRIGGEPVVLGHSEAEPSFLRISAIALDRLAEGSVTLEDARRSLATPQPGLAAHDPGARALELALEAVRAGDANRPAVVHLSRLLNTPCAGDLALLANDDELETFLSSAAEEFPEIPNDLGLAALALERNAFRFALERATAAPESDPVRSRTFANVLETHAGRAAGFPDALGDLLKRARDLVHLQGLIVEENRMWLTDSDPASRVVAFDWLDRRGAAPAGFDPLGSRDERRAALAADQAARAASPPSSEEANAESSDG